MRRWIVAATVATALAGCGGSDGEGGGATAPTPDPEEQVEQVAADFLDAVDDDDGADACALLTDSARAELDDQFGNIIGSDCAGGIASLKTIPRAATIENVDVDGSSATARASGDVGLIEMRLTQVDGEWQISDPGV